MASARTISSSSYSHFETNSTSPRDDSFSSYLALIRQSFSSELANPNSRRSPFQTTVVPPPKRPFKDNGELDVFGAEKYFSGTLDDTQDCSDIISETTTTVTKMSGTRSRSSTCSETSANSRSMLLRDRRPQKRPYPAPRRRSFLDVFRCFCSKKTAIKVEDDADTDTDRSKKSSSKLPGISSKTLHSELSSDLFEIDSISMSSVSAYEPVSVSRSSGLLGFGYVSDKAVRSTVAGGETERVGSLERYHVMMDLESVSVAGSVAARPQRASLGY